MDIERVNAVLTKAIIGFQEGEIEALSDESMDEAKKGSPVGEKGLELIRKICKDHQAEKINGVLIDASSACLIVKIAEKLNPANRKKFLSLDANSMGHIAWKLAS